MNSRPRTCRGHDTFTAAMMRNYRVRRLPVVDDDGIVVGLISLSDLARHAAGHPDAPDLHGGDVANTLAAVCEPRSAASAV